MAKLTLQEVSSILGKAGGSKLITKLNPATAVASGAIQVGKTASKEIFGYDFIGLIIKLAVFYGVAIIFAKFMEGVILARGGFVQLVKLLGYNVPTDEQYPQVFKIY